MVTTTEVEKHMPGHDLLAFIGLDMALTRLGILVLTCCFRSEKEGKVLSYTLDFIVFRCLNIRSIETFYRNKNWISETEKPRLCAFLRTFIIKTLATWYFLCFLCNFYLFQPCLEKCVVISCVEPKSLCNGRSVKVAQMCIICVVAISTFLVWFFSMRRELPSQPVETNRECVRVMCKCASG